MIALLNRACAPLALLGFLVTLLRADPASGANTYNGQLAAGHYTFNRPATASTLSGTRVFFHVVQFKVDGVGTVNVSATGTGFTPRVHLYQNGSFSPYNPLFQLYGVANGTLNAPGFAAGSSFVNHQLVISGSNPTDVGNFSVTITGPGTVTVDTTYDTTLAIGAQPEDGSINVGERVTLGVWASGREPHSFQWYGGPRPSSGAAPDPAKAIAGATNPTYQTPLLNGTTSFWALVTGNATTPATVRSRQATVNVAAAPAQFSGSLTTQHGTWDRMTTINVPSGKICFFETCPFRVFTAGTYTFALNSVGFPASINLYGGTFFPATPAVNFWDSGAVAGAAGALNYSTFLSPGDYDLVTSSASAGQVGTYSGLITGPSVPMILPRPTTLSFLNSPRSQTVLQGSSATMSFAVSGAIPRSQQWYQGLRGDLSQPIPGATGTTYITPTLGTLGTQSYWVRISNTFGNLDSDTVRIRVVNGPITFSGTLRTGNKRWQRANGSGGIVATRTYYKLFAFEAITLGKYAINLNTVGFNGTLSLYSQIFQSNNPNLNHDGTTTVGNPVVHSFTVVSPGTYFLVISSVNEGQVGSYSGTITGPGLVNELPAPAIGTQPSPARQFLFVGDDPAPIRVGPSDPSVSYSWFPGVAPGLPADGPTALPGLNTATNDLPRSTTTQPGSAWYWARLENAYGYNDSELASIEVIPPPVFVSYPANKTGVYGDIPTLTVVTTNAPFTIRWWQGLPPFKTNSVRVQAVQGLGSSYIRMVTNSFQLPRLSPGSYTYWVEAGNPSGANQGGAISVQIAPRPLTVSLTVPEGIHYDALPHAATATATDPVAGGPLIPSPLPITITYFTGGALPSTQAPIRAGDYEVSAVVRHPNFSGTKFNRMRIEKRGLVISAQNMARLEGAENPPLSLLYSGFAGADTAAEINQLPTVSTLADSASPPGLYTIALNGGFDNDYALDIRDGSLQVLEHPVTVAFDSDFSSLPSRVQLEGSAVVEGGALVLTPAVNSQLGQMIIPSPGWPLRALHVSFDLTVGSGNGADGMSFNYAGDIVGVAGQTSEEGIGTGLSLTADTYDNGEEQVPNLGLKYRGRFVAETVIPQLRDGQPHHLALDITPAGLATLKLDGQPVWVHVPLDAWAPMAEWRFSFAARTGGLNDRHAVDTVLIGDRAPSLYLPQAQQTTSVDLRPSLGAALDNMVLSIQANTDPLTATASFVGEKVRFTSTSGQPGQGVITVKATKPDLVALLQFSVTVTRPRIDLLSHSAQTGVGLQLQGEPAAAYYLRRSASLDSSTWSTFAAGSLGLSGLSLLTDKESGGASSMFYQFLSLPPRAPGLIALWRADGDYRDGFGSLHGTPTPSLPFVAGQRDRAFSFDGSERVLKLGGASVPPPWTVGLWVRRQASPDDSSALLVDSSTSLKLEQWPGTRQVGFTQFGVDDYSFGYVTPLETWVHLTFVSSGSDTRLYVNGQLQATHPKSISLPLAQLGRGRGDRLKGAVDEIRVFGSALSPMAVTDLFKATQ